MKDPPDTRCQGSKANMECQGSDLSLPPACEPSIKSQQSSPRPTGSFFGIPRGESRRRSQSKRVVFTVVFFGISLILFVIVYTLLLFYEAPHKQEPYLDPTVYAKKLAEIKNADRLTFEDTVITTAYYPLSDGSAKHTWLKYDTWIQNLFPILYGRIVLFTVPSFENYFSDLYLKEPLSNHTNVARRNHATSVDTSRSAVVMPTSPKKTITYIRTVSEYQKFQYAGGNIETTMVLVTCFEDPYLLPPVKAYRKYFEGE